MTASAAPTHGQTAEAIIFSGSAAAVEPGDAIAGYQWTFDDGAVLPEGSTVSHAFASAGTHTATLAATDLVGVHGTATLQVQVQVQAASVKTGPPPILGCACTTKLPARITLLRIAPSRFRAAPRGPSVTPTHKGTLVSYVLAAAGRVTFTFERLFTGRRLGPTCVTSNRPVPRSPRCTRRASLRGTFARASAPGSTSFWFSGRLNRVTLPSGNYVMTATYARGKNSEAVSAPFRIMR